MSSAALQAAPQQNPASTQLAPHTAGTSSASSRQYQQQARDTYYSQQNANPSSSPSKRASKRPGGNGASFNAPSTPQQSQLYSPGESSTSSLTTPRNQPLPPSTQASPMAPSAGTSSSLNPARSNQPEQLTGPPIPPPPRTSSHQQRQTMSNVHSATPPTDRGTASRRPTRAVDDRPSTSRAGVAGDGRERGDRERGTISGSERERERAKDDTASAAAIAARSRRRAQQSTQEGPQRSSSTRESNSRQTPAGVQSQSSTSMSMATPPGGTGIPREGSAIINRVVITDPEVDIEREQARLAEARPAAAGTDVTPVTGLGLVGSEGVDDGGRGAGRSRQDHSASASRRKDTKFGEYFLGQTLGEGEFGKVKMGWKKDGGVQVAIKLIRRESLGTNPSRLPKIYREIQILRGLSHPNIVRLHEMVETDRHIGIILEYASGGELFDYILNHRYLRDNSARRLFAQLVSGVGYLHKKGIVHRDLKLENLLLDRNKNIIITDFGFANTFDPSDELGDEIEYNLLSKDFVKKMDLERVRDSGFRRGDLMQTSCGSPCYAAPELVVSDSLYTGRKVDVWSCGVILYAMLAGYLPFDDDPANPEGDNINLLYKYIVSTPLTFPEYVSPHARDMLRRILVPEPRKRADLFEVARHSWLSEYAHVVSFITSSTTTTNDIANTTVTADDNQDVLLLARSASVREPSKPHQPHVSSLGGLGAKHGNIDQEQQAEKPKTQRDAKRRTVQVEYVAPQSQTARGEASSETTSPITMGAPAATISSGSRTGARNGSRGPVDAPGDVPQVAGGRVTGSSKPLPKDPQILQEMNQGQGFQSSTAQHRSKQQGMPPPARPGREVPRSVSDSTGAFAIGQTNTSSMPRPNTGGSLTSSGIGRTDNMRLPSRGNSYGQPLAPTVATTNAQGRLAQPKNGKQYIISGPIPQQEPFAQDPSIGKPSTQQLPAKFNQGSSPPTQSQPSRGHNRSNTVGTLGEKIFGRSGSIFSGKSQSQSPQEQMQQKPQKSYPPVSMQTNPMGMQAATATANATPRQSTDSFRSASFGFGRKNSDLGGKEKPRRFSLLPASFSLKSFGGAPKDQPPPGTAGSNLEQKGVTPPPRSRGQNRPVMAFGRGMSRSDSTSTEESGPMGYDGQRDSGFFGPAQKRKSNIPVPTSQHPQQQQAPYGAPSYSSQQVTYGGGPITAGPRKESRMEPAMTTESESSLTASQERPQYPQGFNSYDQNPRQQQHQQQGRGGRGPGVLQKPNRKFTEAYEREQESGYGGGQHSGSSGAARKVMDFFRRRGKARVGE
ncbi:MAG: hypothetical protein M1827_001221 [Pycnora praestabilis]|nr:MAG: hypothetical protein M1827_001221 [Pycnora praestabilis]